MTNQTAIPRRAPSPSGLASVFARVGACAPADPVDADNPDDGTGGQTGGAAAMDETGLSDSASAGDDETGPAVCGDGVTSGEEECDDAGESAACNANCTAAVCGDSITNEATGEDCDDGQNGDQDDGCTDLCLPPACGDGIVQPNAGEDCDGSGETPTCNANCSAATCGDSNTNDAAGELCDDGQNGDQDDGCTDLCQPAVCGDGFTQVSLSEECDGGLTCNAGCETKAWDPRVLVEQDNAGLNSSPQVGIDGEGNAMSVFVRYADFFAPGTIYAGRYDAATQTWEAPVPLEFDVGYAWNAKIAVNNAGSAVAVWVQIDDGPYSVFAAVYDGATGIWGSPQLLENDEFGAAGEPRVTLDEAGNATVVWHQTDSTGVSSVFANHYDPAGESWGERFELSESMGSASDPQLAGDSNGNTLVVWGNANEEVRARRYIAMTAQWGDIELLGDGASVPVVTQDDSGNAAVVWETSPDVQVRVYDDTTELWTQAAVLSEGPGIASSIQAGMDDAANVTVVWLQSVSGQNPNLLASRLDASTGVWSDPTLVETEAGAADNPQLAVHASGHAMVTWTQEQLGSVNLHVARYDADANGWADPELLENDAEDVLRHHIALDDDFNALAVWGQFNGIPPLVNVYAALYN